MDLDIIWKEYYKYCMEKMGAEDKTAEIYLQTCMPLSLEEGVLVLDVATQFAMDQIKSRYLARMKELLIETSFGTDIKLKISSDQPEATKVQAPQPRIRSQSRLRAATALIRIMSSRHSSSENQTGFLTPQAWRSPSLPEIPTILSSSGGRSDLARRTLCTPSDIISRLRIIIRKYFMSVRKSSLTT